MNYKIDISYCGNSFHGYSIQPNVKTVQQTIMEAITNLFNINNFAINASGRTDAYVHAIHQIINIKHDDLKLNPDDLKRALSSKLPNDIRINSIELVDDKFHARYSCKHKTYLYVINTKPTFDLFNKNNIYQLNEQLNINKLKQASELFIGTHDFLSFSTSELNNTTRTINWINIDENNGLVFIKINGNGFLRNMVRMIVANLIAFSLDKISLQDLTKYLSNPKKGSSQLKAPGCGLYLYDVNY